MSVSMAFKGHVPTLWLLTVTGFACFFFNPVNPVIGIGNHSTLKNKVYMVVFCLVAS